MSTGYYNVMSPMTIKISKLFKTSDSSSSSVANSFSYVAAIPPTDKIVYHIRLNGKFIL